MDIEKLEIIIIEIQTRVNLSDIEVEIIKIRQENFLERISSIEKMTQEHHDMFIAQEASQSTKISLWNFLSKHAITIFTLIMGLGVLLNEINKLINP